jgi:hypothetical protein
MSEEQQTEEKQGDGPQSEAHEKAQEAEERHEKAVAKMEELEKDPPEKLEDWPDDEAKYQTFGGGEDGEGGYDEKHEEALGEHSVRHHDDGSVEVKGEKVDDPDEYKGEPIPGGPTDPDAPSAPGEDDASDGHGDTKGEDDGESRTRSEGETGG